MGRWDDDELTRRASAVAPWTDSPASKVGVLLATVVLVALLWGAFWWAAGRARELMEEGPPVPAVSEVPPG
jgi:hypothetical protein